MTISLRISPDIVALARDLAQVLRVPADPLHRYTVVVPRGLQRWLVQQLSLYIGSTSNRYDGVVAGIEFISPSQLVQSHQQVEFPGWQRPDVMWEVMAVLDEVVLASDDAAWAEPIMAYLRADHEGERRRRRYQLARKTAALFAEYLVHRPQMLRQWRSDKDGESGQSVLPDEFAEAAQQWQAPLWRLIDARLAGAQAATVPAALGELYVFMPWDIPQSFAEALDWWQEMQTVRIWWQESDPGERAVPQWGQHETATKQVLAALSSDTEYLPLECARREELHPRLPDAIRVFPCPSRGRQVEVLRDTITAAFAADPTLQPRDVLVLCPQVSEFEPHIRAAFSIMGDADVDHPGARFPVSLAAARMENSLALTAKLACVAISRRATSQQLVELLEQPAVKEKYELGDDELSKLRTWVRQGNIRWGLTQEHAGQYGLGAVAANTWDDGLNRLALGAASGEGGLWADVAAATGVGSQEIELLGKLNRVVEILETMRNEIAHGLSGGGWQKIIAWLLDEMTDRAFDEGVQRLAVDQFLAAIANRPEIIGADEFVDQLLMATVNAPWLQGGGTGAITISDITEIAHVPHRMVVLIGFDEGTYPRNQGQDGDNLLDLLPALEQVPQADEVHTGAQDRHLFGAAVQAAAEDLVIIYSGYDPGSEVELPPAMVISELAEALQIELSRKGSTNSRINSAIPNESSRVQVHHQPLRFYDEKLFTAEHEPLTFDPVAAAWATTIRDSQEQLAQLEPDPWLAGLAHATMANYQPLETISLTELKHALAHPLRAFVDNRLHVARNREDTELSVHIPVELMALDEWKVGQQLLEQLLQGEPFTAAFERAKRQGSLPPGELFAAAAEKFATVQEIADAVHYLKKSDQRYFLDVHVEVNPSDRAGVISGAGVDADHGGNVRLVDGVVEDVTDKSIIRATYSRFKPERLLGIWVDLIAATAMGHPITSAHYLCRTDPTAKHPEPFEHYHLIAPQMVEAKELLADMVNLYDAALREPLPVAARSAHAFVSAALDSKNIDEGGLAALNTDWTTLRNSQAWKKAASTWNNSYDGELNDPEVQLLYGQKPWFSGHDQGIADQSVQDRDIQALQHRQRCLSRFGHYAIGIWEPVLSRLVEYQSSAPAVGEQA